MSDPELPDLSWIKTCNHRLLEEAELVLAELAAEMDIGTDQLKVQMWRSGLPPHQAPAVGEPDPFGELRAKTLQMLLNRKVLKACEQWNPWYVIQANDRVVRRTLEVIRDPAVLGPAPPQPVIPVREADYSWIGECDRKVLDEYREVLSEIRRKHDRREVPQIISPYPDGTDDMDWGEEYFGPLAAQRWQIVSALLDYGLIDSATHSRPIVVMSRREVIVEALRTIDATLNPVPRAQPMAPAPPVAPVADPFKQDVERTHRIERAKLPYVIIGGVVVVVIGGLLAFFFTPLGEWVKTTYFPKSGAADTTSMPMTAPARQSPERTVAVRRDTTAVP